MIIKGEANNIDKATVYIKELCKKKNYAFIFRIASTALSFVFKNKQTIKRRQGQQTKVEVNEATKKYH